MSPSREIIPSEFPGPECRNKSEAGRGDGSAPTATGGTRGWESPTALRGHAGMEAQGRTHLAPPPSGKRPRHRGFRDPQKCHGGSSPSPTGPLRPRGAVTKFVEMNQERPSLGVARGDGLGTASCCPDVSPWDPSSFAEPLGASGAGGSPGSPELRPPHLPAE